MVALASRHPSTRTSARVEPASTHAPRGHGRSVERRADRSPDLDPHWASTSLSLSSRRMRLRCSPGSRCRHRQRRCRVGAQLEPRRRHDPQRSSPAPPQRCCRPQGCRPSRCNPSDTGLLPTQRPDRPRPRVLDHYTVAEIETATRCEVCAASRNRTLAAPTLAGCNAAPQIRRRNAPIPRARIRSKFLARSVPGTWRRRE